MWMLHCPGQGRIDDLLLYIRSVMSWLKGESLKGEKSKILAYTRKEFVRTCGDN